MVIRKDGATKTVEQIKLPQWLNNLITKKWFLYLFAAVVLVLVIGFSLPANTRAELVNSVFAKTATDNSANQQTVTANSQNLPVTTNEWYPVGSDNRVEFNVYETKVTIVVPEKPDGNIGVSLGDSNLWNSGKELLLQLRFKNTNTGEIFESQITSQLKSGSGIRAWGLIMGNLNIDPKTVQWQPKFGTKDRDMPKTKKVTLQ